MLRVFWRFFLRWGREFQTGMMRETVNI
jgi:hypothetical protein